MKSTTEYASRDVGSRSVLSGILSSRVRARIRDAKMNVNTSVSLVTEYLASLKFLFVIILPFSTNTKFG